MKKDDKTEKDNTARVISEENSSPEGGEKENKEQSISRSSKSTNNSESELENFPKKKSSFVRISGRKTLFLFCLMVVILVTSFGYVYRDQVRTMSLVIWQRL